MACSTMLIASQQPERTAVVACPASQRAAWPLSACTTSVAPSSRASRKTKREKEGRGNLSAPWAVGHGMFQPRLFFLPCGRRWQKHASREPYLCAAGGNDLSVYVMDTREKPASAVVQTIEVSPCHTCRALTRQPPATTHRISFTSISERAQQSDQQRSLLSCG